MMNEDAIKYPLADYLANDGGIHINSIELQRPHPDFSNRLVDITIFDQTANNIPMMHAFELKLAKAETRDLKERKRIFNDLIRMKMSKQSASGKCYFIITGKSIHFERDFRKLSINGTDKFYEKWFNFIKGKQVTFNVSSEADLDYKLIYDEFVNKYSNSYGGNVALQLPATITTKCEFITAFNVKIVPYMTGIWSVQ